MSKIPSERNGDSRFSLAVNLYDLQRVDPFVRSMMKLREKLNIDPSCLVKVDKDRADEVGILFVCDLLTAATICDVIRGHDRKASEYPTRVYLRKSTSSWKKLGNSEVLTVVKDNTRQSDGNSTNSSSVVVLNPKIFKTRKSSKLERTGSSLAPPKFAKIEMLNDDLLE